MLVINGEESDWMSVNRVPKGSVLGSLLFVIFSNDLYRNLNSQLLKLHQIITPDTDSLELQ